MKLSVVMPVYSETDSVVEIVNWLKENVKCLHEIIIVLSPKSTKESFEVCGSFDDNVIVHIQKNNPGLGWAYREGFNLCSGTHILMLDSDGEMSLWTIPLMIEKVEKEKCDLVVGSRFMKGGNVEGYNKVKYIYNIIYQNVFRKLFKTQIHDLSFGYKMIKRSVANDIMWEGTMHEFATESTLKPIKYEFKCCEVPAEWIKRTMGKSKNKMLNNLRYPLMAVKIWIRG